MSVIEEIAAERLRQIEAEGWTPEHDNNHTDGKLATAAACYALNSVLSGPIHYDRFADLLKNTVHKAWPWPRSWWKPKDRRRDLIRAGALIVAEIERLDRASK